MARTEAFDSHAEAYDSWFSRNTHVYRSELEAVRHFIPASGRGVEIGVGSGRFAKPAGIKVGVEPSAVMRRLAESRGILVHDGIAEALPLADGSFDFALMVTTICFVDDVDAAFREVRRVLRTGGCFVVGFVDRQSPLGRVYEERKADNVFYRDATFYGSEEMIGLLQRHGLVDHRVIQTVFGPLQQIRSVQEFRPGYGQGGFVVMQAVKAPSQIASSGP